MPSSILSHQGAVLPLKIRYPDKFDGTALCVGSFSPDFGLFLSFLYRDHVCPSSFHSLEGFVYVIPISLLLVVLLNKAVFPAVAWLAKERQGGLLSRSLRFLGFDQLGVLKIKHFSLRWLIKATYSVLIGILSHFLLDLPTHRWIPYLSPFYSGEMPEWFLHGYSHLDIPIYGTVELTNYNILWILFSIGFGILALHNILHIKKHQLLRKWSQK